MTQLIVDVTCIFAIAVALAGDTAVCEGGDSGDSCTIPQRRRRCAEPHCKSLLENDWIEPGDRLIVHEGGDGHVFATVTSDGNLIVVDAGNGQDESATIWQHPKSTYVNKDGKGTAIARVTLLSDRLSASLGDNVVWSINFPSAKDPVELHLEKTGELVLSRDFSQVALWRSGAVREEKKPAPATQPNMNCNVHLTCDVCIAEPRCGWCLARRKCVPDLPHYCDSGSDHVSPNCQWQGQPCSCPSKEERDADILRRHAAKQAAIEEQNRLAEEAIDAADAAQGERGTGSDLNARKLKRDLERRARWADEGRGAVMPYEVLGVVRGATPSEIRRAYRKLSMVLHPDKNPAHSHLAERAFADLGIAYGLVGNPDKRAAFDESGGAGFEESWKKQHWRGDESFFFGSTLIATLTLNLWEQRLVGDSIWLIDLYAAWCPHCRSFVPLFEQVAKVLDEGDYEIDVGAVNCVKQHRICAEYVGVKSYPTLVLLNRESGMMQRFPKDRNSRDPAAIVKWAGTVAAEWKYLLSHGRVTMTNATVFQDTLNTTDMVVALFTDGLDCMPCKTAKTNLMRLSASMADLPVRAVIVDCEQPENKHLCYTEHKLPPSPHRPVLKGWPTLKEIKGPRGLGEQLFDVTVLESHIALELLERALRLALAAQLVDNTALTAGHRSGYDNEQEEEDSVEGTGNAGGQPPPNFDGPRIGWQDRPALQWEGPDEHQSKPVPIEAWQGPRFQHSQITG